MDLTQVVKPQGAPPQAPVAAVDPLVNGDPLAQNGAQPPLDPLQQAESQLPDPLANDPLVGDPMASPPVDPLGQADLQGGKAEQGAGAPDQELFAGSKAEMASRGAQDTAAQINDILGGMGADLDGVGAPFGGALQGGGAPDAAPIDAARGGDAFGAPFSSGQGAQGAGDQMMADMGTPQEGDLMHAAPPAGLGGIPPLAQGPDLGQAPDPLQAQAPLNGNGGAHDQDKAVQDRGANLDPMGMGQMPPRPGPDGAMAPPPAGGHQVPHPQGVAGGPPPGQGQPPQHADVMRQDSEFAMGQALSQAEASLGAQAALQQGLPPGAPLPQAPLGQAPYAQGHLAQGHLAQDQGGNAHIANGEGRGVQPLPQGQHVPAGMPPGHGGPGPWAQGQPQGGADLPVPAGGRAVVPVQQPMMAVADPTVDQLPLEMRNNLEEIVKQLLKPLLREWLERNLPELLKNAVDDQGKIDPDRI